MFDFDKNQDSLASAWQKCLEEKVTEEGILDRFKARRQAKKDSKGLKKLQKQSQKFGVKGGDAEIQKQLSASSPVNQLKKTLTKNVDKMVDKFLNDALKVLDPSQTEDFALSGAYQRMLRDVKVKEQIGDAVIAELNFIANEYVKASQNPQQNPQPNQNTPLGTDTPQQNQNTQPQQ